MNSILRSCLVSPYCQLSEGGNDTCGHGLQTTNNEAIAVATKDKTHVHGAVLTSFRGVIQLGGYVNTRQQSWRQTTEEMMTSL